MSTLLTAEAKSANLKFWTNASILVSIAIGEAVTFLHGGHFTTGIMWSGACLAAGGLIGFLFGIPSRSHSNVQINQPGIAAVDTGIGTASGKGGDAGPPGDTDSDSAAPSTPAAAPMFTTPPQRSEGSNLEQVSDWVTKLLLGGGLTQMQQIPTAIWNLAATVAIGIQSSGHDSAALPAEQTFAAGLLIYFSIAGFFGGYLITKLQLAREIE